MNVNKAIIVGRVTADPQLKTTTTGSAVSAFGVATNRVWKDKNGARQDETEFHNVVVWGRQAEIATQFLKKGTLVYIEGRLRTRSWQDKQGVTHRTTEIICERLQLGPRPAGSGAPVGGAPAGTGRPAEPDAPQKSAGEEEIPVVDIEDDIKAEDLPF